MVDLLVVVPDKTWEVVMAKILERHESIGVRNISARLAVVPGCDPGVRARGVAFAAELSRSHGHAILIFDHEGCGDPRAVDVIEAEIRGLLKPHWSDRADVVVVSPEIEEWLWRGLTHIATALGTSTEELKAQLTSSGHLQEGLHKPGRPKEAFQALLRAYRKKQSSVIYAELAQRMSLRPTGCKSSSFPRLVARLRAWFPIPASGAPT